MNRDINAEINAICDIHRQMIKDNPQLEATHWDIKEIPYLVLNEFLCNHNEELESGSSKELKWNSLRNDHAYLQIFSWSLPKLPEGIYIRLHSTKVKTTVTIVEVSEA